MEIQLVSDTYTDFIKNGNRFLDWKYQTGQNIIHGQGRLTINNLTFTSTPSDISLIRDKFDTLNSNIKILWLCEPRCIISRNFEIANLDRNRWNYILTHDKKFSETIENAVWIPFGGCWIQDSKIHNKSKLVSAVFSDKKGTDNYNLRHDIISKISNIDFYGDSVSNPIDKKDQAINDYHFHVVIENCSIDGFFTEKIIDCFASGTIPIYKGDPSIDKIFDELGIIKFSTLEELKHIIDNLTIDEYYTRMEAIKSNFETMKKYCDPLFSLSNSDFFKKLKQK